MKQILLLLLFVCGWASAADKPNVLFLFADDMRYDSVAALGNSFVKTPAIDSLVRRGLVFNNAYCFGGNSPAVCTPSRNMLLSGKTFFRWKDFSAPGWKQKGILAPGAAPNWPLSMKDAGYLTYHQGKKGNTAPLIQAKFDYNLYINENLDRTCGEPGKMIADDTVKFLKERKTDKPFFMYLAFANPHDPRVAAGDYMKLYERDKVPLPNNWLPMHPFDNGEMTVRDERLLPWPRTEADLRATLHEYYAVISAMDGYMGCILQTLKDLGQLDNTIVIFSADQGIAVGSHGLLGKQNLYDAGMKVPLVFAGPGIPKGSSDALVYLLDIYPTICDLVSGTIPDGLDGRSFKPVVTGQSKIARKELLFAYRHLQRAWRDERWKIIRYPEVNVTQLFDLQNDPEEINDLASRPEHAARIEQMLVRLKAAQPQFGDDLPLTQANPKPAKWTPLTEQELQKLEQPKPAKKN